MTSRIIALLLLLLTSCSKINYTNSILWYDRITSKNDIHLATERCKHILFNSNDTIFGNFIKPIKVDSLFNPSYPKHWFKHSISYRYTPFMLKVMGDTTFAVLQDDNNQLVTAPYFISTNQEIPVPSLEYISPETNFLNYLDCTTHYSGLDTLIYVGGKKIHCRIYKGHIYLPDDRYLTYYLDSRTSIPLKIVDSFYLGTHTSWDYSNKFVANYDISKITRVK